MLKSSTFEYHNKREDTFEPIGENRIILKKTDTKRIRDVKKRVKS